MTLVTAGKQMTKWQVSMMKDYWEISIIKTAGSAEEDQKGFRMFII